MEFLFTSISRQDDFVNVTFSGERGEKIVVTSRAPLTADLDRDGLVKKACALMKQAITHSNPKERHEAEQSPSERSQDLRQALESPAVRSYQVEKRERRRLEHEGDESELTRALEASFPASDPVSPTSSVTAGPAAPPTEPDRE